MIRPGYLDSESRRDLIELARDGSAEHRLARRANALVLLDNGLSCRAITEVLWGAPPLGLSAHQSVTNQINASIR